MKGNEGGGSSRGMEQARLLEPTVHHSSNPGEKHSAESKVHQVPLKDTLMATADDFLLLVLVLPVELELEAEPVAEGLQETEICPEICKKKGIQ